MNKLIFCFCYIMIMGCSMFAQNPATIVLNPPDKNKGLPVMKALSLRSSAIDFDTTSLKLQDLSNLLWAADGINRPDIGKRTAPSAMNSQDIDIYVFLNSGTYLYNAGKHVLEPIVAGDNRNVFPKVQEAPKTSKNRVPAAVICLLVSDLSRFKATNDESLKKEWGAIAAGTVSQNISLFCSSTGLITRPRAEMDKQKIMKLLNLKSTQYLLLNQLVSYPKK